MTWCREPVAPARRGHSPDAEPVHTASGPLRLFLVARAGHCIRALGPQAFSGCWVLPYVKRLEWSVSFHRWTVKLLPFPSTWGQTAVTAWPCTPGCFPDAPQVPFSSALGGLGGWPRPWSQVWLLRASYVEKTQGLARGGDGSCSNPSQSRWRNPKRQSEQGTGSWVFLWGSRGSVRMN